MDHQRVNIQTSPISCGVMELSRISAEDMGDVCYALASRLYHPSRGDPCAFFIWSDVDEEGTNSEKLRTYISKNRLGSVAVSEVAENPRTSNMILVYVCAINHEVFKNWYRTTRVNRLKRKVGT